MSKWTRDKVLKQAKIGNFYKFGDDNGVRVIIDILDNSIKGYNFNNRIEVTLYFDDVDKLRLFKNFECTQEILPEPVKTKRLVKFHQYLDGYGRTKSTFYNSDLNVYWNGKSSSPSHGKDYLVKTSNYIEVEIEVEE